jgi:hypothetical protein
MKKRNKEGRKERRKRLEDEEEDVSSYWMTLRKREDSYWKLKEEELDRAVWRIRFRSGFEPVVMTDHEINE